MKSKWRLVAKKVNLVGGQSQLSEAGRTVDVEYVRRIECG